MGGHGRFFTMLIRWYQYISALLPGSCRYYPTCSEYARWQFETARPDRAMFASVLRILRCNQLFAGGIDYPVVRYTPPSPARCANPLYGAGETAAPLPRANPDNSKITIKYWMVPHPEKGCFYYVIKDFDV